MNKKQKKYLKLSNTFLLSLPILYSVASYAAVSVDLAHKNISTLQSFASPNTAADAVQIEEVSRAVDFNQTLHVRVQETYSGHPVWGGDAIVHVPHGANTAKTFASVLHAANANNGSMNGIVYQGLQPDLTNAPANVFTDAQAKKAINQMMDKYQNTLGRKASISHPKSQLIVYIDKANQHKAHWAFKISFDVGFTETGAVPAKPVYIIDANSFQVYEQWNNLQTLEQVNYDPAAGGGNGGNKKMGELVYDALSNDLPKLNVQRDTTKNVCYWQNQDVIVQNYNTGKPITFACKKSDAKHNDVYWIGEKDAVNNGYGPASDALFGGAVIKDMYQKWYGVPVLTHSDGSPMKLVMSVHMRNYDNAFWDDVTETMNFGDGQKIFYPLTSLSVAAHEISHGFTAQQGHSQLNYSGQSGGMNESFSDMAAQAAEFYAYGKNSWEIGPEIFKKEGEALRYMDKPTTDCHGKKPGNDCSIDDASQYNSSIDVHYTSGVYNRLFYLLGTTPNWDVQKAFDVMVHANQHYWTSKATFVSGACGILKSAADHGYDLEDVKSAINRVKIDISSC